MDLGPAHGLTGTHLAPLATGQTLQRFIKERIFLIHHVSEEDIGRFTA